MAAPRELGYLAVILGLVGLTSASSGPHWAPDASGLLWLAFVAAMCVDARRAVVRPRAGKEMSE